jgi:rfaE bifunctional protein kinase chain/domain
MLDDSEIERILASLPGLCLGVLGDLFLDRYLDIDSAFTEPSLETGLDAYQVVRVRANPGAAGTVVNNLVALGVGSVRLISCIGDDGEGYELRQALGRLRGVDAGGLMGDSAVRTPTYTKPMFMEHGRSPRELNRLDFKNRQPTSRCMEDAILRELDRAWPDLHGLLVLDQLSEENCGVVTDRVRARLAEMAESDPARLVLADSRKRIGAFRSMTLKPNQGECLAAIGQSASDPENLMLSVRALARRATRPVFCTCSDKGMLLCDPSQGKDPQTIAPFPVTGPIDIVGAGDSTSAAIAAALAGGASLENAGSFGNLVASITIQQIGTTGSADPAQVRARWREVARA